MATVKITQTLINNLQPKSKPYWVDDEAMCGLRVYVGARGKTYYLTYKNAAGKKDTFRLGPVELFTPTQARDAAKKILADMAVNGTDIKKERRHEAGVTVAELCAQYLAAGGSERTAEFIDRLREFKNRDAAGITPLEIATWRKAEKAATSNKDSTLNKKTNSLKAVLNFGAENGLLEMNPLARLKKLKEVDSASKTRYLTPDERARLLVALDAMDEEARSGRERSLTHSNRRHLPNMSGWAFASYFKPLIITALNTGIRKGALLALRWDDVDLETGNITLRAETAKAKKAATLPMNLLVRTTLEAWHAQRIDESNPLVWPSPQTGGVMDNCDSSFRQLLKSANITNFRWHDMRHDFASRLVMSGVDLNTVRELMTHGDIKMTLRYAHLAPEKKREAVELLL